MEQIVYKDAADTLLGLISNEYAKEVNAYKEAVSNLFEELEPKIKKYEEDREEKSLRESCDFNAFELLIYDENVFSSIIADMLSPKGTHGQKEVFLDRFLQLIEKKTGTSIESNFSFLKKVQREESTEGYRRIDIYIEFMDGFILAIENKIGTAKDQLKQVEDYIKEIKDRNCPDFLFIYLTPDGDNPSIDSINETYREELKKQGRFTTMSYKEDIAKWLDDCTNCCKSEKYKYFLKDMKNFIVNHFMGGGMDTEKTDILKSVIKKPERYKIAIDIYENYDNIMQLLRDTFFNTIKQRIYERFMLDEKNWIFVYNHRNDKNCYLFKDFWRPHKSGIGLYSFCLWDNDGSGLVRDNYDPQQLVNEEQPIISIIKDLKGMHKYPRDDYWWLLLKRPNPFRWFPEDYRKILDTESEYFKTLVDESVIRLEDLLSLMKKTNLEEAIDEAAKLRKDNDKIGQLNSP